MAAAFATIEAKTKPESDHIKEYDIPAKTTKTPTLNTNEIIEITRKSLCLSKITYDMVEGGFTKPKKNQNTKIFKSFFI